MLPFNQMPNLTKNSRPFPKKRSALSVQDQIIMRQKIAYQRNKSEKYVKTVIPQNIVEAVQPTIQQKINSGSASIVSNSLNIDSVFNTEVIAKLKESLITKIQKDVMDHFKYVLTEHVKSVMSETMSQISSNLESLRYFEDDDVSTCSSKVWGNTYTKKPVEKTESEPKCEEPKCEESKCEETKCEESECKESECKESESKDETEAKSDTSSESEEISCKKEPPKIYDDNDEIIVDSKNVIKRLKNKSKKTECV